MHVLRLDLTTTLKVQTNLEASIPAGNTINILGPLKTFDIMHFILSFSL